MWVAKNRNICEKCCKMVWVCCLLLLSVKQVTLLTRETLSHHFVADAEPDFGGNGLAARCWQTVCVAKPEHEELWPIPHIFFIFSWCLSRGSSIMTETLNTSGHQTLVWQSVSPSVCCFHSHSPLVGEMCSCAQRQTKCTCGLFTVYSNLFNPLN